MTGMLPGGARVRRSTRETRDTVTLELEPLNGNRPAVFRPGQFNMLYVFGVGEVPISVSGNPGRSGAWVHTIRAVGAVSRALCASGRGSVVGLRGPFGTAWPVEDAVGHDVVLMAGGIGLAPLRPAMHYLEAHRQQYGRIALLYGSRSPEELLYPKQLAEWRTQFDLQVEVTVDRAAPGWRGQVGVVTQLLRLATFEPEDAMVFVCGPEIMMRFSYQELEARGVPREHIYVSLERNMKCGIGQCGHCQLGPAFICKDGPVFPLPAVQPLLHTREV